MDSVVTALGFPRGTRVVILHADDVGMCHGANEAFLDLARRRAIDTGSVMVPCPWFPEIAKAAARDPSLDLGVHLTLTSEWDGYRWGPVSTTSAATGLLDGSGYFPSNCLELRKRVVPEAAEIEMQAQIERALAAGIDVTHLDTHMGAALVPELLETTLRVARSRRLPLLLPLDLGSYAGVLRMGEIDTAPYIEAAERLRREGLPVPDRFRMTPGVPSAHVDDTYRRMLTEIPAGLTFFSLHPNAPGDIETIIPPRAHWRTDEYRLFCSGAPRGWLHHAGIATIGFRPIRDLWRSRSK